MSLLFLLMLAAAPDDCVWQEPTEQRPLLRQGQSGDDDIVVDRPYGTAWARCAFDRGAKQPILRVTADDGDGPDVLLQKTLSLSPDINLDAPEAMPSIRLSFPPCDVPPPNTRGKRAVLWGPVGQRRWMNPRKLTIELVAEGALAPLGFTTKVEVLCPACITDRAASIVHKVHDRAKHETRFAISVPKYRYTCAQGGGRMIVRRYWVDKDHGKGQALHPYETIDNLQDKLRPKGANMVYESLEPGTRFCKEGLVNIWEVIGLDEYAAIVTSHYGRDGHILRGEVEHLRCK